MRELHYLDPDVVAGKQSLLARMKDGDLTGEDVDAYAEEFIKIIKKKAASLPRDRKPLFLLQILDEAIQVEVREPVRRAVVERLKDALCGESPEIADLKYSDFLLLVERSYLFTARDIYGKDLILKKFKLADFPAHMEALAKFFQLPWSRYVVPGIGSVSDWSGSYLISDKLNLSNLPAALCAGKLSVKRALQLAGDCISGAVFLEQNGLVLQDISLVNLGMVEDNDGGTRGILFDLEGLCPAAEPMCDRIAQSGYMPPEIKKRDRRGRMEEKPVTAAEMVYQFGVAIQEIAERFERANTFKEEIKRSLSALINKMIATNPRERITLLEAKAILNDIAGRIPAGSEMDLPVAAF